MTNESVVDANDPSLESWVESANKPDTDFPIQNLPFGRFRRHGDSEWAIGVAIGDSVLDLRASKLIDHNDIERILSASSDDRKILRQHISSALRRGSSFQNDCEKALLNQDAVELGLPCPIHNYTDFYVGINHAVAVGKLFRPDDPLLPNYKWVPIGYHGRASTIASSGQSFPRPWGQIRPQGTDHPSLQPSGRLDLELEMGVVIGRPNRIGEPILLDDAESHIFGLTLLNDWSSRDVQAWEYQPLGPFLSKNFFTTISPWIVTLEALEPFRQPCLRPEGDPQPLPYLQSRQHADRGAFGVDLEVVLQTSKMAEAGHAGDVISRSSFASAAYWTIGQMVTHHTVNGCLLQTGDLMGTGTLSGTSRDESGSLLELTEGGSKPIELSNGERRTFLQDGDTIILRGSCARPGLRRIGFGECRGKVLPASPRP